MGGMTYRVSSAPIAMTVGKKSNNAMDTAYRHRKERFLCSLSLIHAILCTAVVERTVAAEYSSGRVKGFVVEMHSSYLPFMIYLINYCNNYL